MRLTVDLDTAGLVRDLGLAGERLHFASIVARTRTALALRKPLRAQIQRRLHNPTRFSLGALRAVTANRANPQAEVRFTDLGYDRHYLTYQEDGASGGPRGSRDT